MSVQSKSINEEEAESFKTDMLGSLLSEYNLIYFFNAYEHGLHFNSRSAKTLVLWHNIQYKHTTKKLVNVRQD
jgi:hypothetical protein